MGDVEGTLPGGVAGPDSPGRVSSVGIVGGGTMGAGIAQVIAAHDLPVVVIEVDDAAAERTVARIDAALDRQVQRGQRTSDDRDRVRGHIQIGTDLAAIADRDLVIEAVPEDLELKQQVMVAIDRHVRDDAIVATNTSSLPVMDLAVVSRLPNRIIGFHFFNPAPAMRLIELVRTVVTDDRVIEVAAAFAGRIGKTPVIVGDRRGFIANQLLFPYLNHAVSMVENGYATKEEVDAAMRLGAGLPMGPLALTDLIGLDTFHQTMAAIHDQVPDVRNAPRPIISQLVTAGFTGRKAGRGFYRYQGPGSSVTVPDDTTPAEPDPALVDAWQTVGVIGSGTMATGIAQVCAQAGFEVVLLARSADSAQRAIGQIEHRLTGRVERGRLSGEDRDALLARLTATTDRQDLAAADVVIEAVAEQLAVKRQVLSEVAEVTSPSTLLATTTSALSVTACAMATGRPERTLGLHFFNPAPVMRLVEIVETVRSDPEAVAQARAFVARLDRVGVRCGDRAGFIVNSLLFPYLNDAVRLLASHYATAEDIDTAMVLGCGYPMGPFALMDVIGLDVTLAILERLRDEERKPAFEPDPLLRHLVDAGFLGRKAGRGFYVYA